ncbi:MAG: 4-hydroxythreonine-4-phosphate dehydrogenase PdxA [Cryomorphaceae bacterium]|jgi:4-phospho-D-threonate 3-dehydrogenase / 4-phospho-D-erythronate 3-dehydrogenase|nr:4-hydroxythreonine-4-phosphate dehydrogenase PdxA [Cryomorphaceae bacterium]|tara:strand:+ start:3121 stop:4173 length:1053 start_codon:yes stop_codon:yes gene_type:complete
MSPLRIAISCGDPNGIGLEVVLKSLAQPEVREMAQFILFCSPQVLAFHRNSLNLGDIPYTQVSPGDKIPSGRIGLIDPWNREVRIDFGKLTPESGQAALESLSAACDAIEAGHANALITAPLSKANIPTTGAPFTGHTGYLGERFNAKPLMVMAAEGLRVALASEHIALEKVSATLTPETLTQKLDVFQAALSLDFGVQRPRIAVLSINPHAGDGGAMGSEEDGRLKPWIEAMKNRGSLVSGPFPSDGFFGNGAYRSFDGVLAMYHDQGLIPFKILHFETGVNNTCGLSFVRTSPDHGVGLDIAGKNIADGQSFQSAIFQAIDRCRHYGLYAELTANILPKFEQKSRHDS